MGACETYKCIGMDQCYKLLWFAMKNDTTGNRTSCLGLFVAFNLPVVLLLRASRRIKRYVISG